MRQRVAVLVHGVLPHWYAAPDRGDGLLQPRRPVHNQEHGHPKATSDQIIERACARFLRFRSPCS